MFGTFGTLFGSNTGRGLLVQPWFALVVELGVLDLELGVLHFELSGRGLCCSCTLFGTNMFGTLFGTYVYGYMNIWIHVDTDIWICIRIYGYMDTWIY